MSNATPYLLTFEQLAHSVYNMSVRQLRTVSKRPDFPKAIELGPRMRRYVRQEHEAFVQSFPRASGEPAHLVAARAAKTAGDEDQSSTPTTPTTPTT